MPGTLWMRIEAFGEALMEASSASDCNRPVDITIEIGQLAVISLSH